MTTFVGCVLKGPLEKAMLRKVALGLKRAEILRLALSEYLKVEGEGDGTDSI